VYELINPSFSGTNKMEKKLKRNILLVGNTDTFPSIEYNCKFRAPDPVVFLETSTDCFLVVSQMEFGRANRTGAPLQVLTPEILGLQGEDKQRIRVWTLSLLKRLQVRKVTVPVQFPHGIAEYLKKHGIKIIVAEKDLFPERAVKTTDELRKIRESQQAAVIAMRAAITLIASSEINSAGYLKYHGRVITAEFVRELIARVLFEHNCMAKDIIVARGPQAADPHENGSGVLYAGETIVIDIFPRNMSHGYWGDLTRTVVKGTASPFMKMIYHAVKAAQTVALNHVKAGIKCSTVHKAVVEEFKHRGLFSKVLEGKGTGFIHSTGHGVGLEIHEPPSVSLADGRLKSGNVITIEPGLYYPGIGGVRIEDTIVVTPSGWRYLVPCEKKFEI
jgi:Xaa-Pro aminopeptidase